MKKLSIFLITLLWFGLLATGQVLAIPHYSFELINCYPHDPQAFTQGLIFHDGFLYEGTGLYGQSSLRKVQLDDGTVLNSVMLADEFFGEGITIFQDQIFQLTWREKLGFIYDLETLEKLAEFSYQGEGWGLTTDEKHLIMSDGSNVLTFLDPEDFKPVRKISVSTKDGPLLLLNELEYVEGKIFANVWFSDFIYSIDPFSGEVLGFLDLSELYAIEEQLNPSLDVLNGIAYDNKTGHLFVTGKLWSHIYEIRITK